MKRPGPLPMAQLPNCQALLMATSSYGTLTPSKSFSLNAPPSGATQTQVPVRTGAASPLCSHGYPGPLCSLCLKCSPRLFSCPVFVACLFSQISASVAPSSKDCSPVLLTFSIPSRTALFSSVLQVHFQGQPTGLSVTSQNDLGSATLKCHISPEQWGLSSLLKADRKW